MKANRVRKVVMSLVLSAALIVQPVAGTVAYAEETDITEDTQPEESKGDDKAGQDESEQPDENKQQEESPDQSKENGQNENSNENSDVEQTGSEDQEESENQEKESEESVDTEIDDLEGEENSEDETSEETEEGDLEESEEEVREKTDENEDELLGFTGMPDTYRLTSAQKAEKTVLASNAGDISEEDEGVAYVEKQIMTVVDSREEAELIAEAYDAEIVSYENELLVMELDEDTSVCDAVEAAASAETTLPAVWPNYYRYAFVEDTDEIEIEETEYEIEENEDSVLDVYAQAAAADPNLDPTYGANYQWHHVTVGSPYAWAEGYTGSGVKVAVLDSGVSSHEDLSIAKNINKSSSSAATDGKGHGTHVAGIIGAKRDNGKGGAGIAPDATLYNIKVLGDDGSGSDSQIYQGIRAAIDENVDLINMSLGGPGYNQLMQDIITEAYNKGIAVFVSAGNDGISTVVYPACYNHVICVAATDNGNGRADFSTYGSWVDLSAPGVDIWSTYNTGTSSYILSSGTSMACPVATGEAAVILSSGMITATGSGRVDALESLMKKNTIKVSGSGMGSGITSLTKVFNLSTAATKPNAPTISIGLSENKQSVDVTIKAQGGMKLCYTTNGKNPVYKDGVSDANTTFVDGNTTTFTLDCSKTAKGTVKAFAVNESGVISAVKSQTYTLSPYVTAITISGPVKVEKGKTISLAAAVTPTYASNKKVTWDIQTQAGGAVDTAKIKIDQKGKITATAKADTGTYKVIVTAQDGGRKSVTYSIQVVEAGAAIQSLAFDKNATKELWITKAAAKPTLSLAQFLTAKEKNAEGQQVEIDKTKLADYVVWTSSKPAVAEVNAQTGVVTAKTAGTTTITAKANDNGNKKATINITVKQGVTGLTITDSQGRDTNLTLAAGKSMALKATITPAKPANKNIKWSISPDDSSVSIDPKKPAVSINPSNGKITTKAGAPAGTYTVTATAADGKGAVDTLKVKICSGAIGEIKLNTTKTTLYTKTIDSQRTNASTITATLKGVKGSSDFDPNAYTVTSSNESIVKADVQSSVNGVVTIKLTAAGGMYGKANVVIASTDGSNKKATCAVTVSGGITKIEIKEDSNSKTNVSKLTLFRSGTAITTAPSMATLYAVITGSDGANKTAYEVTSSNPALVNASLDKATGAVTLTAGSKSTGKATITLSATDGSKKKATCTVTVVNPVSKVNISSKTITASGGNYNMAVVSGKSIQLCATLETEYGAVSNKGVTWSINAGKDSGVSISSSGKVTAQKGKSLYTIFTVTATAKDGSGTSATYKVKVVPAATCVYLGYTNAAGNPVYLPDYGTIGKKKYQYVYEFPVLEDSNGVQRMYKYGIYTNIYGGYISATSSNSKVLEVTATDGTFYFTPRKPGTVTVTLAATDGSGVKISYKFRVVAE